MNFNLFKSKTKKHTFAFYNIENLFDIYKDDLTRDKDFNPTSEKRWTIKRYNNKLRKIGYAISNIGRKETNAHPAIIGLAEVENEAVLNRLAELKAIHHLKIALTTTGENQVEVLKKAMEIEINGSILFDAFQVTYNVFDQSIVRIANGLNAANKRLIIKEAMANGRVFPNVNFPNHEKMYAVLSQLATKYEVGVDAIALRFIADTIQPFKILSGAAIREHLIGNLKVNDFNLTIDEIELLKGFAVKPTDYWRERKRLGWN